MPFWIDTHCHWDAPEFDADRDTLRAAAHAVGVAHCVIPAVERSNWATVRELAHRWGDSYALGIHPLYTGRAVEADIEALADMLEDCRDDPRLVAIGEIGLDFFVPGLDAERQTWFYEQQLQLARRFDLPVILHVRRSSDQLLRALRRWPVQGGIAHAFNGSLQQAQQFIERGFALGFGGALTYERALHLRRLVQQLPMEAIVVETDAPDIPPHWLYTTAEQRAAGEAQGRNQPAEIPRIAQVMLALRAEAHANEALTTADWQRATSANAARVLLRLQPLLPNADGGLAHG
ncbi:TatD family hydrolase [Comamonas sp. JUb58]|uniref:TatD family hydrolase n=1 Tax=Comamonas sp. JUb58 TaxID=2485114 RepID=UPI00105F3DF0|nr:TatD family hydrolase [Comamonas sp. JUb58]TDS85184.1 TatD DNase family protein [Comamonas sp. JUb58]